MLDYNDAHPVWLAEAFASLLRRPAQIGLELFKASGFIGNAFGDGNTGF